MQQMKLMIAEKKTENGMLLVITDEDILGKIYSEKNLQLDLTKSFYQGDLHTIDEAKDKIKRAYILHFTGRFSVNLGVELDLIDPQKILNIKKIPHAEVSLM